jgi:hypothetical protein
MNGFPSRADTSPIFGPSVGRSQVRAVPNRGRQAGLERVIVINSQPRQLQQGLHQRPVHRRRRQPRTIVQRTGQVNRHRG